MKRLEDGLKIIMIGAGAGIGSALIAAPNEMIDDVITKLDDLEISYNVIEELYNIEINWKKNAFNYDAASDIITADEIKFYDIFEPQAILEKETRVPRKIERKPSRVETYSPKLNSPSKKNSIFYKGAGRSMMKF